MKTRRILQQLLKDLTIARISLGVAFIGYLALLFPGIIIEGNMILPMLVFPFFLTITGAQQDEANNARLLLASLPIKRSETVWSKYLFIPLSILTCFTLGIVTAFLITRLFPVVSFEWETQLTLSQIYSWLFPLLLMTASYFPAYFKWGHGRGLIAAGLGLVALSAILSAIFYIIPILGGASMPLEGNIQNRLRIPYLGHILAIIRRFIAGYGEITFYLLLSAFTLIVMTGSILLSMKAYTTRDL